jgi:integration host factor subunit alpha
MTKAELIDAICDTIGGFSKREAATLVDTVFGTMKEALGAGYKIKVSGFGNFVLRDKAQRPGLNPRTGERIVLSPRRVVRFKPSPVLKTRVNRVVVRRSSFPPRVHTPPPMPAAPKVPLIVHGGESGED